MNDFLKILGLATLALLTVSAVLSAFWPALHFGHSLFGILLMAANAFAAIGLLRLRLGVEPVRLILLSMVIRLSFLAIVMLLVIRLSTHGPGLYSFIFSAMAAFVVFQAVEIRHVIRHPELMAS